MELTMLVGAPAVFGLIVGFIAMLLFRSPMFGVFAGTLGGLAALGMGLTLG